MVSFVLSSEITELRSTGQKECAIKTRSGDLHFTEWCAPILARELRRGSGHTMPAQPGYFVIYAALPEKAGGDWQTFRSPVVGWIVIEDPFHVGSIFGSLPIVASVNYRERPWALLTPDGTVYMPYRGVFDSVVNWLEGQKKAAREESNRKRALRFEF